MTENILNMVFKEIMKFFFILLVAGIGVALGGLGWGIIIAIMGFMIQLIFVVGKNKRFDEDATD